MAVQKYGTKKVGTLDELTHYQGKVANEKNAYLVRLKGGVSRDRILKDAAFARTRENMSDFATAGSLSRDIQRLLSPILKGTKSAQAFGRFTGLLRLLMNADATNVRGQRVVDWVSLSNRIVGFNFSKERFDSIVDYDATSAAVAVTGDLFVESPGTTHHEVQAQFVGIDTANDIVFVSEAYESGKVANGSAINLTSATWTHGLQTGDPILVVMGVKFFQEVNGTFYPFNNKSYRAASVVNLAGVPV